EQCEEARDDRLGPHRGILCGREGVEQNGVRLGEAPGGWVAQQRRKVRNMDFPSHSLFAVLELSPAFGEKAFEVRFVGDQVRQVLLVLESEGERLESV